MNYIALSYWDIAFASVLILINGAVSLAFRLGIARRLVVAAVRMCIQLSLIGYVLKFVFAQGSVWWTLSVGVVMVLLAGREVMARQEIRFAAGWSYGLGAGSLMIAATVVLVFTLTVLVGPEPWYAPRYALPLFGMILGNSMTGISLGLDTLTRTASRERAAIEARIALGRTRFDAMRPILQDALRTGLMPIINAMAASGIISLPGMMTGQILAGADPLQAVKYQLMIMFVIAGSTAAAVLLAVLGGIWRLSDDRHRLRLDRLAP